MHVGAHGATTPSTICHATASKKGLKEVRETTCIGIKVIIRDTATISVGRAARPCASKGAKLLLPVGAKRVITFAFFRVRENFISFVNLFYLHFPLFTASNTISLHVALPVSPARS